MNAAVIEKKNTPSKKETERKRMVRRKAKGLSQVLSGIIFNVIF